MDGVRTRGHVAALAAIGAMIHGSAPGAVLLVGPAGVGKTTLATDLAAGLLCTTEDRALRPCGACRACRLVAGGTHPDVHHLGPEGPGRQIVIGGPGSKVRGIRDLLTELSLLPVEGGARMAIVSAAQRMNADAQNALLKSLEEPAPGITIVLCADAEEPLLATIRSRCARLRLGPLGVREMEALLRDLGVAEPPLAARLARISGGRPGVAMAWAARPEALRARDELGRLLLDLLARRPADRLRSIRAAAATAGALGEVVAATDGATNPAGVGAAGPPTDAAPGPTADAPSGEPVSGDPDDGAPVKVPAAERRRAAEALIDLWTDVARDIALCQRGARSSVRDLDRLDESTAAAAVLDPADVSAFLDRLGRASVLVAGNVSPELVLDDLVLAWPIPRRAAA